MIVTLISVPWCPRASRNSTLPALSIVDPGKERHESNAPGSSFTISASQLIDIGFPSGIFASQCERVLLCSVTLVRCFINLGSVARFLQAAYTSLRGLFTTNVTRTLTEVVLVPSTSRAL